MCVAPDLPPELSPLSQGTRPAPTLCLVQGDTIDEALCLSRNQVDSILLRLVLCREQLDMTGGTQCIIRLHTAEPLPDNAPVLKACKPRLALRLNCGGETSLEARSVMLGIPVERLVSVFPGSLHCV